ncbi:hypothetical protein RSAG8_12555, partial [Rhizoctonia solani AG-8 WAC10335]
MQPASGNAGRVYTASLARDWCFPRCEGRVAKSGNGNFIQGLQVSMRDVMENRTFISFLSTITAAAQIHQSEADVQDSVARFVELLCNGIGPLMERISEKTYPAVYGSVEHNG